MPDITKLFLPNNDYDARNIDENEFEWHDINEDAFSVHGLYKHVTGEPFLRMPSNVAANTSKDVENLNTFTAGARIRFKTDSDALYVRMYQSGRFLISHCTALINCGADVYERFPDGKQVFRGAVFPSWDKFDIVSAKVNVGSLGTMREFVVNLPSHATIDRMEIGIRKGSSLDRATAYKHSKPVVYYGSSITHGFCASRPGNIYENLISRKYDIDYINLGFSGSAKGEKAIADYISGLDMSAFVLDYDHNAPGHEHLEKTHYNFYKTIRKAQPDLPIILVSKPDFHVMDNGENMRRAVIMETFAKARRNGDTKIYFVDGNSFYTDCDPADYSVDGCHPTDRGFAEMAKHIGKTLALALGI